MTDHGKQRLAGAAAGFVNGLFGGGGGMVLLPLLTAWGGMEQKRAFATCLAVIYPVCCLSAAVYFLRVRPDMAMLAPCLLGGLTGGSIAGLTFQKVPARVLRIAFALVLVFAGVRYLL